MAVRKHLAQARNYDPSKQLVDHSSPGKFILNPVGESRAAAIRFKFVPVNPF